jgi:hypothetical protein
VTPSPNRIDPTNIPADMKITLSRTICYGSCGTYKVEVFANGSVVANGATWHIPEDQIKKLLSEFHKTNFFALADEYTLSNSKNALCLKFDTTSITINGHTKTVFHSHDCKDLEALTQLASFEDRIEELTNDDTLVIQKRPNRTLDRSGGRVSRIKRGAAKLK